jgi:hypothetical protein
MGPDLNLPCSSLDSLFGTCASNTVRLGGKTTSGPCSCTFPSVGAHLVNFHGNTPEVFPRRDRQPAKYVGVIRDR